MSCVATPFVTPTFIEQDAPSGCFSHHELVCTNKNRATSAYCQLILLSFVNGPPNKAVLMLENYLIAAVVLIVVGCITQEALSANS